MKVLVRAVVILFLYVCIASGEDTDADWKTFVDKYVQFAQENPTTSKFFKALWLLANTVSKTFEAIQLKFLKGNDSLYAIKMNPNLSFADFLQGFSENLRRDYKEYSHLTQDNASESAAKYIEILADELDSDDFNNTYVLWEYVEKSYLEFFSKVAIDSLKMAFSDDEGFLGDAKCQFFENCEK